jgi:hypothetical protein
VITTHASDVEGEVVVTTAEQVPTFGTKFAPKSVTMPPPYVLLGTSEATTGILFITLKTSLVDAVINGF